MNGVAGGGAMWWVCAWAWASTFTDAAGTTTTWGAWSPPTERPGLLVWFHEDGAADHRVRPWLRRVAREHGLRLLVPREPDGGYWWAPSAGRNAAWADAWLSHLALTDGFDPDRVVFAGMSGGAAFAAGLPPQLGWRYRGGVVAACGADVPRGDGQNTVDDPPAWVGEPPHDEAAVAAWFVIGATDELRPLSDAAGVWWRGLGVGPVTEIVTPRRGHCAFSLRRQVTIGVLGVLGVLSPDPADADR